MLSYLSEDSLPDLCPSNKDLYYIRSQVGIKVTVHSDVYDFIGEICSSSDSENGNGDDELEKYLITNSSDSISQVMARTKQTERKEQQNCSTSSGRYPVARRGLDDSDSVSSIEAAARANSDPVMMGKSSPKKNPKKNLK